MNRRLWFLVLTIASFAQAEDHLTDVLKTHNPNPRATTVDRQDREIDRTLSDIRKFLNDLEDFRRSGVEVPVGDMDEVLREAEKQLELGKREGFKFLGKILSEDEKGVLLDNIRVFSEYATEMMNLYQTNPDASPGELRLMASENLAKKWKVMERVKKEGWTKVEKAAADASEFLKRELDRRAKLITEKNPELFDQFKRFLREGFSVIKIDFDKALTDLKADPIEFIDKNLDPFVEQVRKIDGPTADRIEAEARKLRAEKTEYQDFYNRAIRGKETSEIPHSTFEELRRRSSVVNQKAEEVDSLISYLQQKYDPKKIEADIRREVTKAESEFDRARKRLEGDVEKEVDELKRRVEGIFK